MMNRIVDSAAKPATLPPMIAPFDDDGAVVFVSGFAPMFDDGATVGVNVTGDCDGAFVGVLVGGDGDLVGLDVVGLSVEPGYVRT